MCAFRENSENIGVDILTWILSQESNSNQDSSTFVQVFLFHAGKSSYFLSILCVFFCLLLAFELLVHTKREFWSPSSVQELSSFHLVDPNSGGVMMIVMNDV